MVGLDLLHLGHLQFIFDEVFLFLVIEVNFWFTRVFLSVFYLEVHLVVFLALRAVGSYISILIIIIMMLMLMLIILLIFLLEFARLFDVRTQLLVDAIILKQKLNGLIATRIKLAGRLK